MRPDFVSRFFAKASMLAGWALKEAKIKGRKIDVDLTLFSGNCEAI